MDNSEKELLESLKNLDTKKLLTKESFAEVLLHGNCYLSYIIKPKQNDQFEIYINPQNQGEVSSSIMCFFGENLLTEESLRRNYYLNPHFEDFNDKPKNIQMMLNKKLNELNIKSDSNKKSNQNKKNKNMNMNINKEKEYFVEDKNGKKINIIGYKLYQLLGGDLIDSIQVIKRELSSYSLDSNNKELFLMILNLIKYLASEVKNNTNKFKSAYFNRKLLIVNKINAILVSFESIIFNIASIFKFNYGSIPEVEFEFIQIANLIYEIFLSINEKHLIPWPTMIILIEFLVLEGVKRRIKNYKKSDIFPKFILILENLSEAEIKYIRKNNDMKDICKSFIDELYGPTYNTLVNKSYLSYLLSCLKSQNLENKMNALNDIGDIINNVKNDKIQLKIFYEFINNNKILEMIFAEGVHDEIIKRSSNLYAFYTQNNLLDDKYIEKIIERQDNKFMKKLLNTIISFFPQEKKDKFFQRLSKGIQFNNKSNNDIEFISELTEACLNKPTEKTTKEKLLLSNGNNNINEDNNNYYGLNMIFDYIIKDFDDKIKNEENNVDFASACLTNIIYKALNLNQLKPDDIFVFIEKILENIKNNSKHNSVVQSIKLFQSLIDIIKKKKNFAHLNINLKKLDQKYNIILLVIEDLIRYMALLPSDYSEDKIYEGIYPHKTNIEQRLKLIFYFFKKTSDNYGLDLSEKKYIQKLYQIFTSEKYKKDLTKFYEIFSNNLNEIDDKILSDFFTYIFQDKSGFDLKSINNKESINFIIKIFTTLNLNKKAIFHDGRNIRVDGSVKIEGFDMLFDLLTQNSDNEVQNRISDLLCTICIRFKDYSKEEIIQNYWKKYYAKIITYLDNISKSHDKIAFNGIIKLLNKIYSFTCNTYGKIPTKKDYHSSQGEIKTYRFEKIGVKNKEKDYRLNAGTHDTILELRWKLGYYYDIPINNVSFIGMDNKVYTLNNDFDIFIKVFNDPRYFGPKAISVKVKNEPFQFLKIKENPKDFIEKNEILYNILIDNLKDDNKNGLNEVEIENKQKIWNIISKLPKNYFFENNLKQFGMKKEENGKIKNTIKEFFTINEIYIFTYSLQCLHYFLFDKKEEIITDKNEYLNNFINIYSGDKYILDALMNIQINKENCIPIKIECTLIIINVLQEFLKNKISKEKLAKDLANQNNYELILKKLTEIISELLELNYTKYNSYLVEFNDDIIKSGDKKDSQNINDTIAKLIENILEFIEEISKGKNPYMLYMFNKTDLFTKIFVVGYIKSEADESRKVIENYLIKNYGKNNEYIKKYLEIILTVDIFNYLIQNNSAWKYFHVISSIIKKYEENLNRKNILEDKDNNEKVIESQFYIQSKQIIDIILDYIQKECEKDDSKEEDLGEKDAKISKINKENFKEGILLFLSDLIKLNQKELVQYLLNKVNVFDLFINKCLLRKCIEKPLETKAPFCLTSQSQEPVYKLMTTILKNIHDDELYNKIVDVLNQYHEKGFWKTYNHKNWDLDSREMTKGKYVGLQNMSSTCYLNSIIQQLFMIPMLRETILKINNSSKTNILYELQILFSALKIYEFAYYDPRSFVEANKLNFYEQMDADEFYVSLIDKIENDIKSLYSETPSTPKSDLIPKDGPSGQNYKYKNIFNNFFGIEVLDELLFVDCNHKRNNKFLYNSIQLEIKSFDNIYDSLKNYFKTEVMDGDNKINCEICKIKRNCHKHLIFKSLPNILVVILKRFEFDYNTMLKYKLNKYFEFPFKLDMKEYLIKEHTEINTEYELTGITIHYGVADFGHYYDIIKGPDGKWYKFNDISVSEFKEEDIPREAYGEKEIFEEDSSKEKESGKNNAYILFYRKTDFDQSHIDKKMKNELALPPYSKYSNINSDLMKEINYKLYKSWTMKNMASSLYQNFIISLIKFDIATIRNSNIEKYFNSLFLLLKEEKYITENSSNNISANEKEKSHHQKIFEFALRYYFCLYLRIAKRCRDEKRDEVFKQIIKYYLLTDLERAKYFLEEFSNVEVIEEYLIYCPNTENVKICLSIIVEAYQFIFEESETNNSDTILKDFMNTYIIYIDENIRQIALEPIRYLFIQMLEIGGKRFVSYLRKKNFDEWVRSFYGNEKKIYKNIINTDVYPPLKSDHCILAEKNNNNKKMLEKDSDLYEQQFLKNLSDNRPNTNLISKLGNIFLD